MPASKSLDWHFARPQLARHYLDSFHVGLVSAMAFYARRRMGKTEFLLKDLVPIAQKRGYTVGYCNLWTEDQTPLDALMSAIAQMSAPRRMAAKMRAKLLGPISKVKLGGSAAGYGGASAEVEFKATEKQHIGRLRQAFTAFDKSRNQGLLLIDEAQVLVEKPHQALEKALRAHLDIRKDRIKVIFTGSSEDRLRTMFGTERNAFYNWARVEPLSLLGSEFVLELTKRANRLTKIPLQSKDALAAFEALNRVPEFFRSFLSQYLSHPRDGVKAAVEVCRQTIYAEEGFAARWKKMLPADRLILQLVADGRADLHGETVLKWLGKMLGLDEPASRAVPQNALRRLRQRQVLIQTELGVYRFEDEAFRDWLLTENGDDL